MDSRTTYEIIIDEDRKQGGWGNHFAIVDPAYPKDYLFLGGLDVAEARLARMNGTKPG